MQALKLVVLTENDNNIYSGEEEEDSNTDEPPSIKASSQIECNQNAQNRMSLPTLAKICDRFSVSDQAGASIASAVLKDYGTVYRKNKNLIIDRSKVRREREKERRHNQSFQTPSSVQGLYFDGKKDSTLTPQKSGVGAHFVREGHITLVAEPGSNYVGHFTPNSGKAKDIFEGLLEFCSFHDLDLDSLNVIGCDGTNVNTGAKGGVIAAVEQSLGRPLQWSICLLHLNELPLRHLMQYLDGVTSGPQSFSGQIGKELQSCEQQQIAEFEPIEIQLPANDSALCTDQQYLYDIATAVSSGHCSLSLSDRSPGKLSHARWLTTAHRNLRLYISNISKTSPSNNLLILVNYVAKVHIPMWFKIKNKTSITEGGKHFHELIQRSRYLETEIRKQVDAVIQRNAYFAHEENLLLTMLVDDRASIRQLALRRILAA